MEQIVSELRARRKAAGLSIADVAERIGTPRARVSEIENGHIGLTLKRLYEYADALGLKVTIKFE